MHPKEKLSLAYLEHGLKIGSPLTGGNSWGVVKRYTPYVAKHDTGGYHQRHRLTICPQIMMAKSGIIGNKLEY
jgi:hypothetical protein